MTENKNNKEPDIASIILAGGQGTRLYPITKYHSKPAVSYGGRYRLIDIPISNSLNSDIRKIFVIGQYMISELQHHLSQTYQFDPFHPGMIDVLSPEERPFGEKIWFDGTADAVRKNINEILKSQAEYFLILSGDQLYNINFKKMFDFAKQTNADLTIASLPVKEKDAKRYGLLKVNKESIIQDFFEKPQEEEILNRFKLNEQFFNDHQMELNEKHYLASMGIYIFKRDTLKNLLIEDPREDFGKHLIPTQLKKESTCAAFIYDGYWEDIGTVASFYEANIALTDKKFKGLDTYDEENPIFTKANHLPGTQIHGTIINQSIICEGSIIEAKEISSSIIGLRSKIKKGTVIKNSVLMNNNYYLPPITHQRLKKHPEKFEIGQNCLIEKAIIDEHVFIGNNVKLTNKENHQNYDGEHLFVRDGIIIVPYGANIPDDFEF
ncbi:MAG TPA: sugar phosphate nucleotidyltransferase [Chlamydiales bacterium]|nr:sugar phosphate nucleotidyltransferase [Chlamydiales bacterium]